MKKIMIVLCLFFFKCHDDESVISFNKYVHGSIEYDDILTGERIDDQSNIEIYLKAFDNSDLPIEFQDTLKGFNFRFGPLDSTKEYIINARYSDPGTNIIYEASKKISVSESEIQIELLPSSRSYILRGKITYTDVLEDMEIKDQVGIKTILRSENGLLINGKQQLDAEGSIYSFSGLDKADKFTIIAQYTDEINKVIYKTEESVTLSEQIQEHNLTLAPTENSLLLKGNVSYKDKFTMDLVKDQSGIEITLIRTDGLLINGQETLKVLGSSFRFSGLTEGIDYTFTAKYKDLGTDLDYKISDTLKFTTSAEVNVYNAKMKWIPSTSALVTITDSKDNPISSVQVFTYNNYDLLQKYKSNKEASIREGETNEKGQILFTNLNEVTHYFYGLKVIGKDSIDSIDPLFDPSTVNKILKDSLNRITLRVTNRLN